MNCKNCIWFTVFDKREDEPSSMRCLKRGSARYIVFPYRPPCGGEHFKQSNKPPDPTGDERQVS